MLFHVIYITEAWLPSSQVCLVSLPHAEVQVSTFPPFYAGNNATPRPCPRAQDLLGPWGEQKMCHVYQRALHGKSGSDEGVRWGEQNYLGEWVTAHSPG